MRYWVYINDKVDGPYDEEKLATLDGFTPETLICSEEIEEGGSQEWEKASNIFEFDEATKTMTRAPLTEEELNTIRGNTATATTEPPVQEQTQQTAGSTQLLIEKIDNLTREIEGLKNKLDAALAAAAAAHTAAPAPTIAPASHASEPVTEEALITNTESLVNHAEKLVAQAASAQPHSKPADFLDEIEINASKTENLAEKGGEELILRSALDSLYNQKPQTETEKEATFQDLLSSAKLITDPSLSASTEESTQQPQPQPAEQQPAAQKDMADNMAQPALQSLAEESAPASQEEAAQAAPVTAEEMPQTPAPETAESAPAAEITEEKREEIINEITAPAQQNNLILQAIEEAQKEDTHASAENVAPLEQDVPAEQQEQEPMLSLPTNEQPAATTQDLPTAKETLDLTGQPQLNIIGADQTLRMAEQNQATAEEFQPQSPVSDSLTPLSPSETEEKAFKDATETIKELVPGKKLEPANQEEGLISQKDLEEAFTEKTPTADFPIPENNNAPAAPENIAAAAPQAPAQPAGDFPEGKGFYNPNEMTEVELKEGSTYLISDFIPPALTSGEPEKKSSKDYGAVPGSSEAAQASAETEPGVQVQSLAETIEEIVPSKKEEQTDLTLSKVILENTIKTKRGATMDIKTVPMVKEPGDSERLDLSDSDLDINTQHDLKMADIKPGNKKITKIVLGSLASVVILALIYVMLAYLEIIPAQFNFIKSAPAQQQSVEQDAQLNEMLGIDQGAAASLPGVQQQALPQQYPGYASQSGQMAAPGQGMPAGSAEDMQAGQAFMPQQNGQMMPMQPAVNPLDPILTEVKNFPLANGQTLQQLINTRHPAAQQLIEWNITTAVEPDNYSILVKVPPENPQSFKISYRFNYNMVTKTLDPTISDSKNLLDSLSASQPVR